VLKALLEELPSAPVPERMIAVKAGALGLRRPDGFPRGRRALDGDLAPEPEPDPAAYEPIEADLATIAAWAGPRGLTVKTWDDLPAVNRRREHLRLPPFKRAFRR